MEDFELPEYTSPPVREVAVSVQVAPLPAAFVAHAARIGDKMDGRYPTIEVHPPLPPLYASLHRPTVHFDLGGQPSVRTWLANPAGTELIQLQSNRIAYNWRADQETGGEDYPRWQHIRSRFTGVFATVDEYCAFNGLGSLNPQIVEVTYHNVWLLGTDETLDRLLAPLSSSWPGSGLPAEMAVSRLSLASPLDHAAGGALVIEAGAAPDRSMHLQLVATIQLSPPNTIEEVRAAMDFGRVAIVRSFTAMTTTYAHELWGRTR